MFRFLELVSRVVQREYRMSNASILCPQKVVARSASSFPCMGYCGCVARKQVTHKRTIAKEFQAKDRVSADENVMQWNIEMHGHGG
jgi:hypothetical protein